MIAETLRLLFRDFPALMLILALLIAAVSRSGPAPERFLWRATLAGFHAAFSGEYRRFPCLGSSTCAKD